MVGGQHSAMAPGGLKTMSAPRSGSRGGWLAHLRNDSLRHSRFLALEGHRLAFAS